MDEHQHQWGDLHNVARDEQGHPILAMLCLVDGCPAWYEARRAR